MAIDKTFQDIRRRWTLQLYREYELICWQYSLNLAKAQIEINPASTKLGSWHGDSRTIRLSDQLITNASWDIVLQVLKHEMAHQIAQELFQGDGGHGPHFIQAADLIGLPQAFRGARIDLDLSALPNNSDTYDEDAQQPLRRKIRKLFALATSSNVNEADAAMRKATGLLNKYNLRMAQEQAEDTYRYCIIEIGKKRIEGFQRRICMILRQFFHVQVVFSSLYDAEAATSYRTIELFGRPHNVALAEYVYHFLCRQLEELYAVHRKQHGGSGLAHKRSYWLGILDGFYAKMESWSSKPEQQGTARSDTESPPPPVAHESQAIHRFISGRYPKMSWRSQRQSAVQASAYGSGMKDGGKIVLHRPVEEYGTRTGFIGEG